MKLQIARALLCMALAAAVWMLLGTARLAGGAGPSQPAPADGRAVTYVATVRGVAHPFNFDGPTPFVNPGSGVSNMAAMGFDGGGIPGPAISNAGSGTVHIRKVVDPQQGGTVTRVQLLPSDQGHDGWRTQFNSYPLESYRSYQYELEFKLDPDWNFGMQPGAGLLWQIKGMPRPDQWGNPSLALNLVGNRLSLDIKYPSAAMQAVTWPQRVAWGEGEYVPVNFSPRLVQAGRYHRIIVQFTADDRPAHLGGRGRLLASFDGEPWINYSGPTLHPDQKGPHRLDFGWYQWEGRPSATRTVYFRTSHLYLTPQE